MKFKHIPRFLRQPKFLIGIGLVLFGGVLSFIVISWSHSPISADIRKQLNFSALYPGKSSGYSIDASTMSYMPQNKVLIFHVKNKDNDITLTQQATPDPFNDLPDYYPKLVERLHGYSTFDSIHGKVSLTRPEELKGGQSAVFNGKGTLMFAHPAHDLSNDEWRALFKSMIIER